MDKLGMIKEQVDTLNEHVTIIKEDISEIKVILAVNTKSLEDHMARSKANEEAVQILRKEFKPVHEHVLKVNFIISIIGTFFAGASSIYAILKLLSFFGLLGINFFN